MTDESRVVVSFALVPTIFASSSSGVAFSDRQLIPNFELRVEIFCVPTCFHVRIPKSCLSVPREKKSPWLHQYQSYISNWYINGKVFTSTTAWKPKNSFFLKKNIANYLTFLLSCFVKKILVHTLQIDRSVFSLFVKHWQVCTIEPSLFKTTLGMYRRPFEGRHLVLMSLIKLHFGQRHGIVNLNFKIFIYE